MFEVGTVLVGKINNGYGITNNESLCIITEIINPDRNYINVEVIAHNYYNANLGHIYDVDANSFDEITVEDYFKKYPNAYKCRNFDDILIIYNYSYEKTIERIKRKEEEKRRKEKEKLDNAYNLSDEERKSLTEEIFELLNKFGYNPTEKGINAILDEWAINKGRLIKLFKNHPNYNGKYQIVFDADFKRELDFDEIHKFANYIKEYSVNYECKFHSFTYNEILNIKNKLERILNHINKLEMHGVYIDKKVSNYYCEEYERFKKIELEIDKEFSINKLRLTYDNKIFTEENYELYKLIDSFINYFSCINNSVADADFAEKINTLYPSVKAVEGQKISRIVNKVCKLIGIDKDKNYNRMFAKFSDAVNPLSIKRHTILSIHPIDYYTMSFGVSWASCHTIDKNNIRNMENAYHGAYSGGTESYMLDETSVVFYTIGKEYEGDKFELEPKINRNMFHIGNDKIIQGRVYPQCNDSGANDIYKNIRNIVQKVIADCYNVPNLWELKKGTNECYKVIESKGVHYKDYESFENCNVSYLKLEDGTINLNKITVGHDPICPNCGKTHKNEECIECRDCYDED